MPTEFELAEEDKFGSIIYIIGSIITIITANKAEQMLIQTQTGGKKTSGSQADSAQLTTSQLVVLIDLLFVIGNIIFGQISYFRLEKIEEGIAAGTEKRSAIPDKIITFGWILGVIGSVIRLAGAQLRVEEENALRSLSGS